jgi:PAS domain S-box-containing protein
MQEFLEKINMEKIFMPLKRNPLFPWLRQPVIWVVLACGLLLPFSSQLPAGYFFDDPVSYLPLHTALEFFSIAVAFLIFAIVWHTREKHEDGRSMFLASLFLGVAILDFFHTLSFMGMPALVTPSEPGKAIHFWLAARLMAAVGLLGSVLWTCNIFKKGIWQLLLLLVIVTVVSLVSWVQLYHPEIVPVSFVPGKGLTEYKVNMEYFISVLYLIAAGLMFYRSERASRRYWLYLGAAALVMMFSECYFTLYEKVTDVYNLLGHVYKVIAYSIVYLAVFIISVQEPYRQLQRMQKRQEHTYKQLREAQKIAHLGQWELEYSTHHLTWSEGIYELFEIDAASFGASYDAFLDLCLPEDREKINDRYSASVRDHTPYEFVHRLLMKDGRTKWVRESGVTEYDAEGQPERTKGVTIEITSIMEMEASLRSSEMYYRTVTETLPVPLAINDIHGNITFLNQNFVQTFGYNLADIPTVNQWWSLAYPDQAYRETVIHEWEEGLEHMQRGEPFPQIEVRVRCKNGEVRTVLAHPAQLSASENLVFLYDITERKQGEKEASAMREQLAQSTKMESIGHLTAGIAHDFNNMLGAMMGYSELSQHMIASGQADAVGRYQEEILKAGTRAKELIAQMLTFSRLAPGTGAETPTILLTPIVKEVVALLRSSIPSTVDLNYHIENEDLKTPIQPVQLHQIILNLGINARDAMGEYGKIDISLSRYHSDNQLCSSCKMVHTGDYARITVKDSGSGIPRHILNQIFDPFFTTKGVGKGTGMGLSVVHGLVHATGGHIQVESDAVSGTAINILLPLASSAAVLNERVDNIRAGNIKGVTIMVVDDEQSMTTMLQEFLTIKGARVISFVSPILALEAFRQNADSIDIVVTDETMPGLSGMHLAEHMLKLKPALPIILCTGYSEHATPDSAAQMGISGFFYKPLKMNELLLKIQLLLQEKKD